MWIIIIKNIVLQRAIYDDYLIHSYIIFADKIIKNFCEIYFLHELDQKSFSIRVFFHRYKEYRFRKVSSEI
jgi:hypothetical protein